MTCTSLSRLALVAVAVAASPPLLAQQPPASGSGQLEEIVVTAKQRAQNLQEVPLSITVFNSRDIQEKSLLDPRDVAAFTPNFNFYGGTGRQAATEVSLRGLSPNTTDERYQGVSFFLDGVPVSGSVVGLTAFDIERIEVIKGPQSATFGRTTYSGAVDFVTSNPTPDRFTGTVMGRYLDGSDGAGASDLLSARVEFPLVKDKAWAALTASDSHRGALGRDLVTGWELGREDTRSYSAVLYMKPTEALTVKLRANRDEDDDSHAAVYVQHPRVWKREGTVTPLPGNPALPWTTEVADPDIRSAGCQARTVAGLTTCDGERTRTLLSGIVTYDLASGHELSYRGGYLSQKVRAPLDSTFAGAGDPLFSDLTAPAKAASTFFVSPETFNNQSHQLRITSPGGGRLAWRAGVAYLYEYNMDYALSGGTAAATASNPKGQRVGKQWSRFYGAFGGIDYRLMDPLTMSLEARVERETVGLGACTYCQTVTTVDRSESTTNFLPRVTFEYALNDAQRVYALYAYGTKPGRYNDTVSPTFPFATKEKLDNFEIGSKNTLAGGAVMLNVALFLQNVEDQQFRSAIPGTRNQLIQNVAKSRIWGFEVEGALKLGESWTLTGGLGHADHEYLASVDLNNSPASTTVLFPVGQANLRGLTSINTAPWTGNAAIVYARPLAWADHTLRLRSDYVYRASTYSDTGNIARTPPSHRVNLRGSLVSPRYELALVVNNLTDDRTALGARFGAVSSCYWNAPEIAGAEQCLHAGVPRPREYGIEARFNF